MTAMTSMAASSSRMLRAPMSAVIAEPPAPAMSRAAAIGAASRTTPTMTAAPVSDSAPSWRVSWPICSEMVAPRGRAISTTGQQGHADEERALLDELAEPPANLGGVTDCFDAEGKRRPPCHRAPLSLDSASAPRSDETYDVGEV